MEVHDLVQGEEAWDVFRLTHDGASEAAAMLGVSKKTKRSELLYMKKTGTPKEFSAWVQKNILDYGHEVEAMARPIVEQLIGESLYPVTCSDGRMSASCDGLTMSERIAFEHKQWNEELAASVAAGILPEEHQPQCQQIMMVTGAEKVIFVVSDGTPDRFVWMEVFPDVEWQKRIRAGWEQFHADLAEYVPVVEEPAAIGRTPESLPALRIEVTGMVTASNLDQFKEHALTVFKGINRELTTDQHFADAEKTVKWCKDIEERLAAAKQHALSQTESIDALFRAIDEISAEARATRLELDRLVEARKKQIRVDIQNDGVNALAKHIESLNIRLGKPWMPGIAADFAGVMKGKRTISSLRDAVDTELARAKIAANEVADRIQANLTWYRESATGFEFLFADLHQLIQKDADYFQLAAKNRIDDHKAAEAKREMERREKIAAEERAKAEAKIREEQEAAASAARQQAMMEAHQQRRQDDAEEAERVRLQSIADQALADARNPSADVIALFEQAEAPAVPTTPPTLKLGQIGERLGFALTADFLRSLGFEGVREKGAVLFHESDFHRICDALVNHIASVQQRMAA